MPHTPPIQGIDDYCCVDCGIKHLTDVQKKRAGVHTAHLGICCVCGKEKMILSTRHYNYLRPIK